MTSEGMWRLFTETGNVLFYCIYKELAEVKEEKTA